MKKALKSFTFYFLLLSLFMIYMHYIGQDSKSIGLIHLNLVLENLQYNDIAKKLLDSGPIIKCNTTLGSISIYWYYAHFITFAIYGIFLDFTILLIKKAAGKQHNI